jgi:predicted phage terminase large subunit-like protein
MGEIEIRPQPGPQTIFAATPADIAIFGGAAGPGKSWSLVYDPLRWSHIPGFTGVIFRRTTKQLKGGGSVWEESQKLYPYRGGLPREGAQLDWRFPSGATIEFCHLQHEQDKFSHKSKQYAYIGFDEATDFTSGQFWYLLSRNRSVCGVRPYVRGATNPDPDSEIRKLIDWWIDKDGYPIPDRSGVLRYFIRLNDVLHWAGSVEELRREFHYLPPEEFAPKSFTFIPAKLDDNRILIDLDPEYRANLLAMHELDRLMLLGGNWNVRPTAGDFFPRDRVTIVDTMPDDIIEVARGWDKAATKPKPTNPDPDWTVGTKIARTRSGRLFVLDVRRDRLDPLEVEQLICRTAKQDGKRVKVSFWQDPAQAGKFDVAHFKRLLMGYVVDIFRASKDKTTFAKPFSSQWLGGNVYLLRGSWNEPYLNEMEAFPSTSDNVKDDQVDSSSVSFMSVSAGLSPLAALEAMTKM